MGLEINYPGPYELRIAYTPPVSGGSAIQRTQRLNVDIVEPNDQADDFSNYTFIDRAGGSAETLDTLVEDWLTLILALYNTGTTIDGVELHKFPEEQSNDSIFWASYTPTANVGTNGSPNTAAGQNIYSFTSQEGGTQKVMLMEDVTVPGPPVGRANLSAASEAIVDFVLNGDGVNYAAPFLARDTSYPIKFNRQFPGRNEKLWKVRNGR